MSSSGGHILVVEPNDVTRKLIVGILNKKGFETYEAPDGGRALGFLNKELTLIILDIEKNNVDTVGFITKIRMDNRKLPLVVMAEDPDEKEIRKALDMPRLSVMSKPIMPDKLLNSIEKYLMKGVEEKISMEKKQAAQLPEETADPQVQKAREGFMRRAIDLSEQKMHENCGGPFGAVIVKNGRVIGEGWNAVTSSNDPTAHAEVMAIRAACRTMENYRLEGSEIYASCEPCPMCLAAIYWAHIDRVFYANTREDASSIGFDDDFLYRELAQPEYRRVMPSKMILRDEAQIVFEEWIKKVDRTSY